MHAYSFRHRSRYYSNQKINACLILKGPDAITSEPNSAGPKDVTTRAEVVALPSIGTTLGDMSQRKGAVRVQIQSDRDSCGGMTSVQIMEVAELGKYKQSVFSCL